MSKVDQNFSIAKLYNDDGFRKIVKCNVRSKLNYNYTSIRPIHSIGLLKDTVISMFLNIDDDREEYDDVRHCLAHYNKTNRRQP